MFCDAMEMSTGCIRASFGTMDCFCSCRSQFIFPSLELINFYGICVYICMDVCDAISWRSRQL